MSTFIEAISRSTVVVTKRLIMINARFRPILSPPFPWKRINVAISRLYTTHFKSIVNTGNLKGARAALSSLLFANKSGVAKVIGLGMENITDANETERKLLNILQQYVERSKVCSYKTKT